MRKRYKIGLVIIVVLILAVLVFGLTKKFFKKEEKPKNTTNVISNIEKYGYSLDDRDTKYMKETFEELKKILEEEVVDEQKYAETLTKLYIIDFYTLYNKINKYDVGSLEYVYHDKQEDFKRKAMDTIYKYMIDNSYHDRMQELPEVTNVQIINYELSTFELDKKKLDAHKVEAEITYKKDLLNYPKKLVVYLVKNNNKLEVVHSSKIEEE